MSSSSPAPIRRAYTECRYGQMHYRDAGPRDGARPAVVMLHQNPSSGFEYEPLIAQLATDRRVIALDTPGYGMSDAPLSPPGITGYAVSLADGVDALIASGQLSGPVDLFGFHTGTLLSVDFAIERPELVRRIVLSGVPLFPAEQRAKKLHEAEDFPTPDEEGSVILGLLERLYGTVVRERDPAVPLAKALLNFSDKARVLDRFTWAYKGVWSWDYDRLRQVTHPVLMLQPHEHLLEWSREAARILPNATLRELPELNRDIFDVAPELLADEIRTYLDRE